MTGLVNVREATDRREGVTRCLEILIVDSDERRRQTLAELLEREGHRVAVVGHFMQAIAAVEERGEIRQ